MPHISIKMLKGRTDEQKTLAGIKVADALAEAIGCDPTHISVSVEDFTPVEWQDVYKKDVTENANIVVQPNYDPKSLLK
jgi:phenylpyruvate tautomerase PptA (4-oxalocrotonate tautomerase family)